MTAEEVDRSLRQMRQIFGFFGVAGALYGAFLAITGLLAFDGFTLFVGVIDGGIAFVFLQAFLGLGRRDVRGYKFARISSIILLFGFPILTFFGISYLRKLGKPAMQAALAVPMA